MESHWLSIHLHVDTAGKHFPDALCPMICTKLFLPHILKFLKIGANLIWVLEEIGSCTSNIEIVFSVILWLGEGSGYYDPWLRFPWEIPTKGKYTNRGQRWADHLEVWAYKYMPYTWRQQGRKRCARYLSTSQPVLKFNSKIEKHQSKIEGTVKIQVYG